MPRKKLKRVQRQRVEESDDQSRELKRAPRGRARRYRRPRARRTRLRGAALAAWRKKARATKRGAHIPLHVLRSRMHRLEALVAERVAAGEPEGDE